MNNKKKTFSILILRPNGKQSLQIQLSTLQIKAILSVIIISSALIFYSFYFGTEITTKRMNYKTLQKKTVEQEQEIEQIKLF